MFRVIHREVVQLAILMVAATGAFSITRSVAANNHDMNIRDAAQWYQTGERAVAAGRFDDAIPSLRRAVLKNPGERRYTLALAAALTRTRDYDAARAIIFKAHDTAPEDPQIDLELARLAVTRHDVTEAIRFYHLALYAPWPAGQEEAQRQAREALIRFLLDERQTSLALSEVLALAANLPDSADAYLTAARLFFEAGDARRARDYYGRALQLDPRNAEARHAVRVLRAAESRRDEREGSER